MGGVDDMYAPRLESAQTETNFFKPPLQGEEI